MKSADGRTNLKRLLSYCNSACYVHPVDSLINLGTSVAIKIYRWNRTGLMIEYMTEELIP
jgi:hypothetical protein